MRRQGCIVILFLIVLIIYFRTETLYAFNVSPGRADFTVKAGEECIKEFIITNSGDNPIFVKGTVTDIMKTMPEYKIVDGKGGFTLRREYLLTKVSKIYPEKVHIPPKEIGRLKLKINMPYDARGEYYGSIFFETLPTEDKESTIGISSRIGMALYVAIEGTEVFNCEIGNFEIISADPLKFALIVKNLGNVHMRPEGYIQFRRKANGGEFQLDLNEIHAPILPNTELDIGNKKTGTKIMPGEYTAFIHLEYGKGEVIDKEIEFTVEGMGSEGIGSVRVKGE